MFNFLHPCQEWMTSGDKSMKHFSCPGRFTSDQIIIADRQPSHWFTGHYLLYKNTSHGNKVKNVCHKTLISKVKFNTVTFKVTTFRRSGQILYSIFMPRQRFIIPNTSLIFSHFFSFSKICSLPGGIPPPLVNAFTVFSHVGPINVLRGTQQELQTMKSRSLVCPLESNYWFVEKIAEVDYLTIQIANYLS